MPAYSGSEYQLFILSAGRCSFEAGHRHVDVSKVIWLGTSNIGHDLVFEHQGNRPAPETPMSREEYVDLMALLRPRVSDRLGVSAFRYCTRSCPRPDTDHGA